MKKNIFLLISCLFVTTLLIAQDKVVYTQDDKDVFDKYANYIQKYRTKSTEKVLEKTAEFFLNTPYVASTLEVTDEEQLIVNLRELDCVTFIETVIALSQTAKSKELSFDNYINELRKIRYRDDEVGDYSTRLHYTSDWVYDNEKDGLLKNISSELNGVKESKKINFMSSHRKSYKHLETDDSMLEKIIQLENDINNRGGFFYVPKSKINSVASRVPHMAMIGFTTSIDGLDTTHTGFAYKKNGKLTFIHASSVQKKVVIDKKTLSDYCASQKNCTGVIFAKVK